MKIHVGDTFEIGKRYDKGGYPFVQVTRLVGRVVYVRDLSRNGSPTERERPFRNYGNGARATFQRYWKRASTNGRDSQ